MGVPRGVARLLLEEAKTRTFRGSLLQIGRSSIFFREDELRGWAKEQGVRLTAGVEIELSHDARLARHGCLSDRTFFRLLGFDEVVALDISPWEGTEILHDFNRPVPCDLEGRYDAVFEAGTIQHLFDIPTALENMFRLLRPGGLAIHGMTTSSNHVDHGFYMFSPTLFHDFYAANRWAIGREYFFEFTPVWIDGCFRSRRWTIYRYEPGCLDHLSYGGFGRRQVGLFVVATKTAESTGDRIPQQGWFDRHWSRTRAATAVASIAARRRAIEGTPGEPVGPRPAVPREPPRAEAGYVRLGSRCRSALFFAWKLLRASIARRLPRRMPDVVHRF